jgi:Domain of unknown function (DUF1990)
MFFLLRPTEERIRAILARQQAAKFSYTEVGASRGQGPQGYAFLHNRVELGRGSEAFAQAREAVRQSFYVKARREESFLVQEFGEKFGAHAKQTGMFLPKIVSG